MSPLSMLSGYVPNGPTESTLVVKQAEANRHPYRLFEICIPPDNEDFYKVYTLSEINH